MRKVLAIGLLAAVLVSPAMAQAEEGMSSGSRWTNEPTYSAQAGQKLVFGVKNVLLGWTELFTETKDATDAGENVLVGLGRGLGNGVLTTLGGAAHAVTFPITAIDVPLPDGGL